jgi:hypothetical protein
MIINNSNDLLEYLKKNIEKGYTLESLKIALIRQGYSSISIEQAIRKFNEELSKKVPVFKEKPKIRYEIFDEQDRPVKIKKPFWRRFFI